ncbi:unnamed protein product [Ectocarpus sp. CCAP 1310/34]|nr:unnamed protein product [Ectocarpus sp. CCAP 1310/34]
MKNSRTAVAGSTARLQPPEWAIFMVAIIADLVSAAGLLPVERLSLFRGLAVFLLYKEWALASACGFVLPRVVPLIAVCFLKQKWRAFKASAQERLNALAATANERAGVSTNVPHAGMGGNTSAHRHSRHSQEGKVSGYDVSSVSGEEVVELSSWAAETASVGHDNSSSSGARVRQRNPLR